MSGRGGRTATQSKPASAQAVRASRAVAGASRAAATAARPAAANAPAATSAPAAAPAPATPTPGPTCPANPDALSKSDRRRAQIIAAARELYEERGLARTSVQDITARVGVTRSLFYHYFADKDAVTSAVLDDYIDDYLEALSHWNAGRREGDIDHALATVVRLLRLGLFEDGSFHAAMATDENAALYLEFVNRVVDHTATYIIETTVRDYADLHEIRIQHLYETFYVLISGVIGYLRQHPDADDAVIADVIAQTLYLDRPQK